MGQPNFKRLAELGLLQEDIIESESLPIAISEINTENKIENKIEITYDFSEIEGVDLETLNYNEVNRICKKLRIDTSGGKEAMIARINLLKKEDSQEKKEIEKTDQLTSDYIDDLLV